jgi:hypothetical protein
MAVNVQDLRQGQGYVRCRRCYSIFNALSSLGPNTAQSGAGEPPQALPAAASPEQAQAAPAAAPEPAAPAPAPTLAPTAAEPQSPLPPPKPKPKRQVRRDLGLSLDVGLDPPSQEGPLHRDDRAGVSSGWRWAIVSVAVLVVLALAARAVHDLRQELVAVPALKQPLTRLYALFGVALEPHWDLSAYDVRQLGAEAQEGEPPRVFIRISIANTGTRALPDPVLRVTLIDRFGSRVGLRELTPREYLRDLPESGVAPGARRDITLQVPNTGSRAEGFEIDPCLTTGQGQLRCAHDPPQS